MTSEQEEICANCARWQDLGRDDNGIVNDAVSVSGELLSQTDNPRSVEKGNKLLAAAMSGVGERNCPNSKNGKSIAFGIMPCVNPNGFVPKR